jgi:hypothetical protein
LRVHLKVIVPTRADVARAVLFVEGSAGAFAVMLNTDDAVLFVPSDTVSCAE